MIARRNLLAAAAGLTGLGLAGRAAALTPPMPENGFVVRDARVFDGTRIFDHTTVIVREGLIEAVGPGLPPPNDLPIIEGANRTLTPGLIDSHVHVFPTAQADALRFGVTTEMDMFSLGGPEAHAAWKAQREGTGRTTEADTWTAGPGVTPPGGHPSGMAAGFGVTIDTLAPNASADAFVAAQVAKGADYLKVFQDDGSTHGTSFPVFSDSQLADIVAAAHARGRLAVVHVAELEAARTAIAEGADGLAHVFVDASPDKAFLTQAREANAFVIPTLAVFAGADEGRLIAEDPAVAPFLSPMQQGMLTVASPRPMPFESAFEAVQRLRAAGVTLLAGTDAPNPGTAHGVSLHVEMALLVRAGMTPLQALHAATAVPARVWGLSDRGRIAPGLRADLVLLNGDVTEDITVTRRIAEVWKNGYRVNRMKIPEPPQASPPPEGQG